MLERKVRMQSELPVETFGSLDSLFNASRTGSREVYLRHQASNLVLPFRWIDRDVDATIVVFSGAVSYSIDTVPIYSGMGVGLHLEANMLLISDPTLQLSRELTLGWYAGNRQWPTLQEDIRAIIKHFAKSNRIILFGGSGGGFAALDQAARIPGSTVVASNPQTDIRKYYASPVERYLSQAWGGWDNVSRSVRTEVVSTYAMPLDCNVVVFQNLRDSFHLKHHFMPFKERCSGENRVVGVTSEVGAGHKGLGSDDVASFLQLVVRTGSWSALLSSLDRFFEAPIVEW